MEKRRRGLWTQERIAAWHEGQRRLAEELKREAAHELAEVACRELAGCVCKAGRRRLRHVKTCTLARMPQDARKREGWTDDAREAAAARQRARWAALSPLERLERVRKMAKAQRRRSEAWKVAMRATMRRLWRGWRDGSIPVSAARVKWLRDRGMWPD